MPLLNERQVLEVITVDALLERVKSLKGRGFRLAQIGAAVLPDHLEVNYSFAQAEELVTLRLQLPDPQPGVPSISSIYWCAVLYENELHDLFKLEVRGMAVDFDGKFYQTAVPFPFGSRQAPAAKQPPIPASPPSGASPPGGSSIITRTE